MIRHLFPILAVLALLLSACGAEEEESSSQRSGTRSSDSNEYYDGYYDDLQAEALEDQAWRDYQEECNYYREQWELNGGFEDEAQECEAVLEEHYWNEYNRDRYYEDQYPEDYDYSGE